MTTLPRLLKKFIRLEVMAAELYHAHIDHVPVCLKPIMHHFWRVEEHHRDTFQRIYRELVGHPAPTFPITRLLTPAFAWCLSLKGPSTILRFECFIEDKAIRDYTQALNWIKHPDIRRAIHNILEDENVHGPLLESLKTFRHDEEEHVRKMEEALQHIQKHG